MRMIYLLILMIMVTSLRGEEYRTWTESSTGRTLVAKIMEKAADNSRARLILKKGGSKWLNTSILSKEDQEYVKSWAPTNIRMRANTVAVSTKRSKWSDVWGSIDSSGGKVSAMTDEQKNSRRVVGVFIDNRGFTENFIMEVFWLGFPLNKKTKRVICAMSARPIKIPAGTKESIGVSASYNYRDTSLLYLESDTSLYNWEGFYVRKWSGYGYGGWAIRISDGEGEILAQSAAQPSFLRHIELVPVPTLKTVKK